MIRVPRFIFSLPGISHLSPPVKWQLRSKQKKGPFHVGYSHLNWIDPIGVGKAYVRQKSVWERKRRTKKTKIMLWHSFVVFHPFGHICMLYLIWISILLHSFFSLYFRFAPFWFDPIYIHSMCDVYACICIYC